MLPSPEAEANLVQRRTIESVVLGPELAILPSPESYLLEERVHRGEAPGAFLGRLGISAEDVRQLQRVPAVRLLRGGQVVTADIAADGRVRHLSFPSSREMQMRLEPSSEGFRAQELPAPLRSEVLLRTGVIQSSLFAAADAAGVADSAGCRSRISAATSISPQCGV
jgi:hypothetical protein